MLLRCLFLSMVSLEFIIYDKAEAAAAQINCNDGRFYIRKDPESCSHFYKCDNGRPVRFKCSLGTYFNPSLYVCDWPYNVKCDVDLGSDNNGQPTDDGENGNNQNPSSNNNGNPSNNGNNQTPSNNDNNSNNGNPNSNDSDDSFDFPMQDLVPSQNNQGIPRPTVDDFSNGNNPYQDYINKNPNIDIRK